MFDKLFGKKQPTQSQSTSGVTATGGQVQVGQAGEDLSQTQSGQMATQQQGLTGTEVLALLDQLRGAIDGAAITPEQKQKLFSYLQSARQEATEPEPDKELIGQNLKRVGETMKTLKDTTEAGKSLWQTGKEVLKAIAPWVGVATAFFGF